MLRRLLGWLNGAPVPPPWKADPVPVATAWSLFCLGTRVAWDEELRADLYPGGRDFARDELDLTRFAAKYRQTLPRLVYLVCTRERVRFSTRHPVRRGPTGLVLHLEVGSERRPVRTGRPDRYGGSSLFRPPEPLGNTDTVLTCRFHGGREAGETVHEFLRRHEIDVGIDTRVEHVGVTDGLASLAHLAEGGVDAVRERAGGRDVFVYHLLFTPSWDPVDRDGNVVHALSRDPAPDEDLDAQVHLAKEILVDYFRPACQPDLDGERARMREHLRALAERHPFDHARARITSEEWGEYYNLFSGAVAPASGHDLRVPVPRGE